MPHIKRKYKIYTVFIILTVTILFSGYIPLFNDYFYESFKKFEQENFRERKSNLKRAYNPLYDDFLHINEVDEPIYNFNAKGKCYILTDVQGTDFTSFILDDEVYNVSYGLNSFPKDFGDEFSAHRIEFNLSDISGEYFKWFCIEPLFIAQDNITVNLEQEETFSFYAGGPISILLQPNFSYNWLSLEVDGKVINEIYNTSVNPEVDSSYYSYFIEEGSYLQFDLDMEPIEHSVKIKGNGSINYRILVNLDWDKDLIQDVDEIQQKFMYEELDPTIPNIWGCFEKSGEYSFIYDSIGNNTGYFYFYIPENYVEYNSFSVDLYSGTIFEIIIDEDFLTYKDLLISTNYQSNPKTRVFGKSTPGHHYIQYKYDSSVPTEISFRINHQKILVLDKPELKDTDCDGVKDREELASGLNPYNPDTDQDFLPDNMDSSPLTSLTIEKNHIYQIVLSHNKSRDSLIEFTLKKPEIDYSTNGIPRRWHNSLNVNVLLVLRVFGGSSIIRDTLVEFWKGDKNRVKEFSLVEGYDSSGICDSIPHPKNPYAEYNLIYGSPSQDTIQYELKYPKMHPAKNDSVIDIRFDFIWLVTQYDSDTGSNNILHFYDVNEDLILESMINREYGNVTYILGSPDSMIENQILWTIAQNPQLKQTMDYDPTDDIKFQGETNYLDLGTQLMIDRGIGVYPATYGFEEEDFSTWNLVGQDRAYFDIIDTFKGHTRVLSINDVNRSGTTTFPRAEQEFDSPKLSGTIEFWFAVSEYRNNYTYIFLGDNLRLQTVKIMIDGYEGAIKYFSRGSSPQWVTLGYIESNEWHHMKIDFDYSLEKLSIYIDGNLGVIDGFFSLPPDLYGLGFNKISFAVEDKLSIDKSFYIDALDYSWARLPSEEGRNREPIYNIDEPDLTENEVLYVAGLQKNSDILNKINLMESYQNPSAKLLSSRDFISYNSYYTVFNLHSSINYTFLDEEARGDHKICYTYEWFNYSKNGQQKYEQRVNVEGYPIRLQLLPFQNSKVLKVTQALGNGIPLDRIPQSINDQLHDKIKLWNQTYIEKIESDYEILPIHFDYTKDLYKDSVDNRLWEVDSSRLIFSGDIKSFAEKFSEQVMTFEQKLVKSFGIFSGMVGRILKTDAKRSLKKLIASFNKLYDKTYSDPFSQIRHLNTLIIDLGDHYKEIRNSWSAGHIDSDDYLLLATAENTINIIDDIVLDDLIKKVAKAKLLEGIATFIDGVASIIILSITIEEYKGKELKLIAKWAEAITKTILGAITIAYARYALIEGGKNTGVIMAEGLGGAVSKIGKYLPYIGYIIQAALLWVTIWEVMETYRGFGGFIITNILLLSLDAIAVVAAAALAPSTYGLSFVVYFLLAVFLFPWLNDLYVLDATPKMKAIEEESGLILPNDNIKRHGGLEVGDPISYRLVLENTGGDLQRTYVRARFGIGQTWTDYYGSWKDYWGDWGLNDELATEFGYSQGERFDHNLTLNIPEATENLKGELTIEIGGAQYFFPAWYRTPNLYEPETTDLNFGLTVFQSSIEDFFADTNEIHDLKTKEMLESELKNAMVQYKWKDASAILQEIKKLDPDYPLELPISTNIDSDMKENIIEIDPSTGSLNTYFDLDLEGWDNPLVDYKFTVPEDFSITPNYFPTQYLSSYHGTNNFDYEMKKGYYYGTYDFDYEMEEELYYGTYDFREDDIGGHPGDWIVGGSRECEVRIEEALGGHENVLKLYDRDKRDVSTYAQITQNFEHIQSSGAVEYWFRTDNAEKATHMTVNDGSSEEISLKVDSNQLYVYQFYYVPDPQPPRWGYWWAPTNIEIEDDNWVHFKITFECDSGEYDGLDAYTFNIYIDGVKVIFEFPLYFVVSAPNGLDKITFKTDGTDGWYSSWFDAIGYSWDDWSHEGLGYEPGWNYNPKDIKSFIEDGWDLNSGLDCSVRTVDIINGHKNVLEARDDSIYFRHDISNLFDNQSSGTVEFWFLTNDASKNNSILLDDAENPNVRLQLNIMDNKIGYWDGSSHFLSLIIESRRWYHVKIEFDCDSDWHLWIDGVSMDEGNGYPYYGNPMHFNQFRFTTSPIEQEGYSFYFDAISYSWDLLSHDGLGYKLGRNINPYDIEPLLNDGFENIRVSLFDGNSITTIDKLDKHDNVIVLNHLGNVEPVRLYKYFDNQTSGTIEWWMRTNDTFPQTALDIGSGVMIAIVNDQIAYYSNSSWYYTGKIVNKNTWYHFRIDFKCGSEEYMGLSSHQWNGYVNGDMFADREPISVSIPSINYISLTTDSTGTYHSYFDGIGFSWDSNYTIGNNMIYGPHFKITANDLDLLHGGTYYFEVEITSHESGKIIFFDHIPFKVPIIKDLRYDQSNVIFREDSDLGLNQCSSVYSTYNTVEVGNIINVKCTATGTNEVVLNLMNHDSIVKQYLVIPKGNLNFEEQFVQIFIDESLSFNRFMFSGLGQENDFILEEILIMDSLRTTSLGQVFNPLNVTNNGNLPEFISFSFIGVPFDFVDESLYPDEFHGERLVFTLMPGESRVCLFNISEPVESISNIYSRQILGTHPVTNEVYCSYIDNLRIDGIYIDSPKNITYYKIGSGSNNLENGILLNIITEEDLVWTAYSLDNQPLIDFSGCEIIPMPEKRGSHKIQVIGNDSLNNLFISEPRYFSVAYPLNVLNPDNVTYYEPMSGYYLATYGFENEKLGTFGTNINFVDFEISTGDSRVTVIKEIDGHKKVLDCHNTQFGMWNITQYIENNITMGTVEFYWRTNSLSASPWIFSFLDKDSNWGTVLYQNKLDGGDLWFWDKTGSHDLNFRPYIDIWHHFRIDFNTKVDSWNLTIDGKIRGLDLAFRDGDINKARYIYMQGEKGYGFHTYYDAIGFSWDSNYDIGDNLKEGLLLSYSSGFPNIEQLDYSMDGQEKKSFLGETVIPLPKNGLHSIKFYATRSCGEIIKSEETHFTVNRSIKILTPERKLYTELNSGYYPATYNFDYEMEEGLYYGTYDFRGDNIGGYPENWTVEEIGISYIMVEESLGGHKKVVRLFNGDNEDDSTFAQMTQNFEQSQSGTIEYWFRTDDADQASYMTISEGSDEEIRLKVESNRLYVYYYIDPGWIPGSPHSTEGEWIWFEYAIWKDGGWTTYEIEDNRWVHFKITFECGSGEYDGLIADAFNIYIDGVKLQTSFDGVEYHLRFTVSDANELDKITFRTYGTDGWYSSWFDAIGYSWDGWSHDEIGYKPGWNSNPYNIIPFMNDGWKFNLNMNCSVRIIEDFEGHKNVLEARDNSIDFRHDINNKFDNQSSGFIEFWFRTNDASKNSSILLDDAENPNVRLQLNIIDNKIGYWDGSSNFLSLIIESRRWYHVRIEFDCDSDWHLWIDGVSMDEGNGYPYYGNPIHFNQFRFTTSPIEQEGYSFYFDAIGYSWDTYYNVGDNRKEGLLLSFNTPSDLILQNIKYSLDGQNNITISGNTMIPAPVQGTHSIQVFGTDLEGYAYESDLIFFSYLTYEFQTLIGTNVSVYDPRNGIEIIFDKVIGSGFTKIKKVSDLAIFLPSGFVGTEQYYDITTTALYENKIHLRMPYDVLQIKSAEENLRIFYYEEDNSRWVDITSSIDTVNNFIYAVTSRLSIFAVLEIDPTPPVVLINHEEGDNTDGIPGKWNVIAYDLESNINYTSIKVFIDEQIVGNTFGYYSVPNNLGKHTIYLEVKNNNAYKAIIGSDSHSVTIIEDDDTTKPIITSFTEDSFSWNGDLINLLFTVTAEDVDSGVGAIVITIGGYTFYGEGTHSVSLPSDFYTLEIWVTDNDNDRPNDNLTTYELHDLIFDLTAPITTPDPIGTEGLNGWYTSNVTVNFAATDDTSGVAYTQYSINNTGWKIHYGPCFIQINSTGITSIEYYSTDILCNEEEPNEMIIKIDKEAPITSHSLSPAFPKGDNDWYVALIEMTLFPYDLISGVLETYYRVNGSHSITYNGPVVFSVDSTYIVEYWSIDKAGLIEDVNIVHFKIDQTAPTTNLTIGVPNYGYDPIYITTDTKIVLDAIDNPLGSGVKEIMYQIDSNNWQTYSSPFTINSFGSHKVRYFSIDMAGNSEVVESIRVEVNLSELTYWGEVCGVYSDLVYLEAKLIDMATQLPIPDKFIVFWIGTQTVVAQTNNSGIASATLILNQPEGLYNVSALFKTDYDYQTSSTSSDFFIEKEHAYAQYTGNMVVPLDAETITLRVTVFDDDDGNWGDLTKINVTITILDSTIISALYPHTYSLEVETTNVNGVGVAIISIDNNLPEGSYLIQFSIEPNENYYYEGDNTDYVTLIIYEPKGDFITGGGWIEDSNGNKGNFGFNVKYKKNGLPKGQAIYVYREGDFVYVIKANAWIGMAIIPDQNYSIFEAKCNIKQINATTGEIVWEQGNYRLVIEVWDHSQDGKEDVFQIRVYDKIGLIYYEAGFDPYGHLMGGNIVIHTDKKK